jgi:peptidyl-Lys metalloendopeptidase
MYLLFVLFSILFSLGSSQLTANLYPNLEAGLATVTLELVNTAPSTVALLRWNLPLDNRFGSNSFLVQFNGHPVTYLGPVVKYFGPFLKDYVFISANQSITMDISLGDMYDFTLQGKYDVRFEADIMDYMVSQDMLSLFPREREAFTPFLGVVSNSLQITTHEYISPKAIKTPYPCSSQETSTLNTAAGAQKSMISYALSAINQGDTPTYKEWFGTYTSARGTTTSECISAITDNSVVAYACDDQAGVYAYVYPSDTSHTIYCCEAFWTAPNAGGFDTKAGTLIHELSHFSNLCGTNDWVYGVNGARNLAITNPSRAVSNADNYEYFSEVQW